jgi:hypothetical protein
MVMRSIRRASERTANPACAGCPFETKCEIRDDPQEQESEKEER